MGRIGRWLSSKIETYITGIIESRIQERIQSLLFAPSGDDSPPLPEDKVLLIKIEGSGKHIVSGVLCSSQGAEKGEKKLFSRDSNGNVKATIYLKSDGTIEINGNADFAVAYTDLNTALQTFLTDLNTKLTTAFATVPYVWPGTSVDISGSKVDEVKLP